MSLTCLARRSQSEDGTALVTAVTVEDIAEGGEASIPDLLAGRQVSRVIESNFSELLHRRRQDA